MNEKQKPAVKKVAGNSNPRKQNIGGRRRTADADVAEKQTQKQGLEVIAAAFDYCRGRSHVARQAPAGESDFG